MIAFKPMKIVIAIDSFKECLLSAIANKAADEGVKMACPNAATKCLRVSDGGEGWLEAYRSSVGGEVVYCSSFDPLMRPIQVPYLIHKDSAVIEIAQVIGLGLLTREERNPLLASSFGVGILIKDALAKGCRSFIIGLGGSATSDAGRGMMKALSSVKIPKDSHFTIATDVDNPLFGPYGAAAIFAPQKGATPAMIHALDEQARTYANEAAAQLGYDRSKEAGAGAAGGLGYAFLQFLHAERSSGIDLLLDSVDFDSMIAEADLIITGEGHADRQTLMGKVPSGILKRAKKLHVPTFLIAGKVDDRDALLEAGFADVIGINKKGLPFEEAIKHEVAYNNIKETAENICKELRP